VNPAARPADDRGFTLVEVLVVCVLVAVLAAVALPTFTQRNLRTGRLDAVAALMRVQSTQEQYRSLHGMYAGELSVLQGAAPVSTQGLYAITLERAGPDAFVATASARGRQASDSACSLITLRVTQGFPTEGPAPDCWQR
jgi:type IV pilus assembly protein PilE